MAETKTSGAPDKQLEPNRQADPLEVPLPVADGKTMVWDERNVLVHPEADEAMKRERDIILGLDEKGEQRRRDLSEPNPDVIKVSQQRPSQTEDPLTNPKPVFDPNTMPSFSIGYDPQKRVDDMIVEAARTDKQLSSIDTVDETKTTDAEVALPSSPSLPTGKKTSGAPDKKKE